MWCLNRIAAGNVLICRFVFSGGAEVRPEEFIPINRYETEFKKTTGRPCPLNGRKIYALVIDGVIPADRRNGRWGTYRRNFGEVTEVIHQLAPQQVAPESPPTAMSVAA